MSKSGWLVLAGFGLMLLAPAVAWADNCTAANETDCGKSARQRAGLAGGAGGAAAAGGGLLRGGGRGNGRGNGRGGRDRVEEEARRKAGEEMARRGEGGGALGDINPVDLPEGSLDAPMPEPPSWRDRVNDWIIERFRDFGRAINEDIQTHNEAAADAQRQAEIDRQLQQQYPDRR